jgi:hypothetical protein
MTPVLQLELTNVAAKKFLQQMMGAPVRDNRTVGNFTCLIVGGVAVLAYIIRVIARFPFFGGNWGLDDWVMTASIVSLNQQSFRIWNLCISDTRHTSYYLRISP